MKKNKINIAASIFILWLYGVVMASIDTTEQRLNNLEQKFNAAISKAGISFDGVFKGEYFSSIIDGNGRVQGRRASETNEYTSVDFDIKARPNSSVQGRLIFRMHQNWQNFFSDISNPIFSRWISIDGTLAEVFSYNVGDLRARYSPLTLYCPEIEILYEPQIFETMRKEVMEERFLSDNFRPLQGVQIGFDAEVAPIFNEAHLSLIGSRLRSVETSIQNGSKVSSIIEASPMEKFFIGENADVTFLKGIRAAQSCMYIFDNKANFRGSDTMADTMAQRTIIVSGRLGADPSTMAGWEKITLRLGTEMVFSSDDSVSWNKLDSINFERKNSSILGSALRLTLETKYSLPKIELSADAAFLRNDNKFRNELAQSPSFIGMRIMNIENDISPSNYDATSQHYTTFDALYNQVFKFAPAEKNNLWWKAPFQKISYTNAVFTQNELSGPVSAALDPSVQLVMPMGPATPNRVGVQTKFKGKMVQNKVEATLLLSLLKEAQAQTDTTEKTSFSQLGGGFLLDIASFIDALAYPLLLNGSYVISTAENNQINNERKISSGFLNLGLSYKFWKRSTVLCGFQMISNNFTFLRASRTNRQSRIAVGLSYEVNEASKALFQVGRITSVFSDDERPNDAAAHDFGQTQVGAKLNVKF